MRKIALIALRDFAAAVASRAFIVGLLIAPASLALLMLLVPRLARSTVDLRGDVGVIDPTCLGVPELQTTVDGRKISARRQEQLRQAARQAPDEVRRIVERSGTGPAGSVLAGLGAAPDLRLVEFPPSMNVDHRRSWLIAGPD